MQLKKYIVSLYIGWFYYFWWWIPSCYPIKGKEKKKEEEVEEVVWVKEGNPSWGFFLLVLIVGIRTPSSQHTLQMKAVIWPLHPTSCVPHCSLRSGHDYENIHKTNLIMLASRPPGCVRWLSQVWWRWWWCGGREVWENTNGGYVGTETVILGCDHLIYSRAFYHSP